MIGPLLGDLDGGNREDVSGTYDFARKSYVRESPTASRGAQAAPRRITRVGLLVTATDYVARADSTGATRAVRYACAAGAVPFVSDVGLTRIAAVPGRCR